MRKANHGVSATETAVEIHPALTLVDSACMSFDLLCFLMARSSAGKRLQIVLGFAGCPLERRELCRF